MTATARMIGVLAGDIVRDPAAQIKYGLLFEAIARRFTLLEVYDAQLRGFDRAISAARTFCPDRQRWRERFYKNAPAFMARSRQVAAHLKRRNDWPDVVLQIGGLFDTQHGQAAITSVIYTDYTAQLAIDNLAYGRSLFTPREHERWFQLERQAYDRAAHIFTRSHIVKNSIVDDYGIAPDRVTAIGGGVNFHPLPAMIPDTERHAPTVLFIGNDFYRKGGDILLRAFARVWPEIPDARLICVTNGPIPAELPLERVDIIQPTWDRQRIASLYRDAALFVLPSRHETWGDVLLEAMAFGLPCIGVAGEAMAEIIAHEETGLIVAAGSAERLAAAIIALLSNSAMRRAWGRAARRRVEAHFTWTRVVEHMVPVIGGLVQEHVST